MWKVEKVFVEMSFDNRILKENESCLKKKTNAKKEQFDTNINQHVLVKTNNLHIVTYIDPYSQKHSSKQYTRMHTDDMDE